MVGEVAGEAMNEHAIVVLATGVDTKLEDARGMSAGGARGSGYAASRRAQCRGGRAVSSRSRCSAFSAASSTRAS